MPNLISGSMHHAYSFTKENWRGLLEVSLIPLFILLAAGFAYFAMFFSVFYDIFSLALENQSDADPAQIQNFISKIITMQLGGLLFMLVYAFLISLASVRIVRFFVRGERGWWRLNKELAAASGYWFLYSIGIYFISMIGIFLLMIPLGGIGSIIAVIFFSGSEPGMVGIAFSALLGLAFILAMFFLMFAIPLRFASGLPVVALGEKPDMFRDMWGQSKGFTLALTLRALALYFALMVIFAIIFIIISAGSYSEVVAMVTSGDLEDDPAKIFEFFKSVLPWFIAIEAVLIVISIPVFWLVIVWLSEVNRRLFQKRTDADKFNTGA